MINHNLFISTKCFSNYDLNLTKYIFSRLSYPNCSTFSGFDIYNMNGKQKDFKRRKRKPGKRCLVIFCNKTSADGVSPRLFPDGESVQRQWITFVRTKREPNSWISGSGHICRDDFSADNYQGLGEKISGF